MTDAGIPGPDGTPTRRRVLGWSAAGGVAALARWRAAFSDARPYKIGSLQPLTGVAASGGKTALVGVQMAVDRINKMGGINGRPVELIVVDSGSKPDVGRREAKSWGGNDRAGF
jgi:branched-chain amino acid transport system substrate-binding protein